MDFPAHGFLIARKKPQNLLLADAPKRRQRAHGRNQVDDTFADGGIYRVEELRQRFNAAALERLGLLTALTLEVKVVGSSYMAGEDAALHLYSPPQYSALSLCWEGELPIVPCCRQHDSCDITMMTYSMPRSLLKSLGECQNVIPGCAL